MVQEQGHVDGHVCGDDGVFRQTGHFDDRFRRCTQREEISCLDAVIFKVFSISHALCLNFKR